MNKFQPNKSQIKAFYKVVKAMEAAKKTGLRFYGKQDVLVAYNEHSEEYVKKYSFGLLTSYRAIGDTIPHLSGNDILDDSGADDYPQFLSNEDNPDSNEED